MRLKPAVMRINIDHRDPTRWAARRWTCWSLCRARPPRPQPLQLGRPKPPRVSPIQRWEDILCFAFLTLGIEFGWLKDWVWESSEDQPEAASGFSDIGEDIWHNILMKFWLKLNPFSAFWSGSILIFDVWPICDHRSFDKFFNASQFDEFFVPVTVCVCEWHYWVLSNNSQWI